jgi:hypothetical protein
VGKLHFVLGAQANSTILRYVNVGAGKTIFPIQNSKILFSDLYGRSCGEIVPPGFLDHFTKNYHQDLKNRYIDSSRHRYKIVVNNIVTVDIILIVISLRNLKDIFSQGNRYLKQQQLQRCSCCYFR